MAGYISLHRDIQKHWLYEEERTFSKYEAWLDILMKVNHTEGKVMHNGKLEIVDRGSTIWSMGDMESKWGWSNRKVKRFLDCLVNDQMLSYKSTTKKTYLNVINYDFYQDSNNHKAPQKHHGSTTEAFQKHTNNNVNNEKNDNKEITTIQKFESVLEVYRTLHNVMDIPNGDNPILSKMIADGITPELIISVMTEKHTYAISQGRNIKGFKYYADAIRERHEGKERVVTPFKKVTKFDKEMELLRKFKEESS